MRHRSLRVFVPLILALALNRPATAQTVTFLGVAGSGCVLIPPGGGTHAVPLTMGVAAGNLVVVTVAAAQNIPLFDPISDTGGNSYPGENARFSNPVITKTYSQVISNALTTANTVNIGYMSNGSGGDVASCAVVSAFSNVSPGGAGAFTMGDSSMGAANKALQTGAIDTTGSQPAFLFFATFATATATGGLSAFSPFNQIAAACASNFCVSPFYRVVNATGSYQATATSVNNVVWAGTIEGYKQKLVPDLAVSCSHSGSFTGGTGGHTYTITARNLAGSGPTQGTVTVTDVLPSGMTATGFTGTGWTCQPLPTLSCSRSDALAASASYPDITLTVTVAATSACNVSNTASVSGGGETNTLNDSASDPTTIIDVHAPTVTPPSANTSTQTLCM
jgi:uncharacterized repeat protein (TIGR01451 family)